MIELQDERDGEPLFLDEDPAQPRRVERDTSHIDRLFADEDVLGEPQYPDPLPARDAASPGSARVDSARAHVEPTLDRPVRISLIVALVLAVLALGVAAVRAFLLQ